MAGSYRELKVWQRAVDLSVEIYRVTKEFPREETYGLSSQLRRAAVSIASNIAEGYGRGTKAEFRHFLALARGSVLEVQTQLLIVRRLEFCGLDRMQGLEDAAEEIGKMLWRLMESQKPPKLIPTSDLCPQVTDR